MDHISIITKRAAERECNANGQPPAPAPLLDSPLPTPRRSCASVDASRLRCRRGASPLRTHVPFSWESSPGVPKNNSACGRDTHKKAPAPMPPPRPPPGRPQPCLARNSYYGNTSEASSDDDDRSFSDALDRISSPERTGSFDRVTSKRFEDIFVGRATSFAKDRARHPAAEAADFSASGRHPRQPRWGSTRRGHDGEDRRWTPRLLNDNVPMQLMQRIRMDAEAEEMTPRACGLMVFFPWSAKPAVCGCRGSLAPAANSPSPRSHSRRITTTTTLRDVIKEDNEATGGDLPQPRGEKKRGREDVQPSRGWGVSSLLDTSKKYCTDARKALSKLSIGLGADSGSPRVSSERRGGRLHDGFSSTPATPAKLTPQLKASRN
ncbi:uncharacterized protein C2845_PM08G29920 [Panicum miliaceum]|uniref:Uncharacterized protein n=1 Tax=Panicum miliaceum TaxID=4540 RepID=A0A3L6QX82_PANMI|nr:uncharacterized protein C2845_PM08G29920 [Panicum miliaceum]